MSLDPNASATAASPFDIPDDASLTDVIKFLQSLQEAFANHNHDGVNSQSLVSLILEALSVSKLDIPNTTSANSFHVDSVGNAWWGATTLAASVASVLKTGVASFKNISSLTAVLAIQSVGGGGTTIQNANTFRGCPTLQITPLKIKTLTCNTAGIYTFSATGSNGGDAGNSVYYLFKNGVSLGSHDNTTQDGSTYTIAFGDFVCAAGDVFDLYCTNDRANQTFTIKSFFVQGQYGFGVVINAVAYGFVPTLTTGTFPSITGTEFTKTLD